MDIHCTKKCIVNHSKHFVESVTNIRTRKTDSKFMATFTIKKILNISRVAQVQNCFIGTYLINESRVSTS